MNAVRSFVYKVNFKRQDENKLSNAEVYSSGLLDEIFHFILREYEAEANPNAFAKAYSFLNEQLGEEKVRNLVFRFVKLFPPSEIYSGKVSIFDYLNSYTENRSNFEIALEELLLLYLDNFNPANKKLKEFFDEKYFDDVKDYLEVINHLNKFFLTQPKFGPENQDIFSLLITPIINNPNSLWDQLEFIRAKWGIILKDFLLNKIMTSKDIMREETKFDSFADGSLPTVVPVYKGSFNDADNLVLGKSLYKYAFDAEKDSHEPENFTKDIHWMPLVVMIAKNTYVWLDQLSKKYQRPIKTLDQIPDEELDLLASWNFNALWLIGIWERSSASKRIKHIMGNIDAVASAYSLDDYRIAEDIGGEDAYANLNFRAKKRGIKLASDMVPNHTGIQSKWVIDHPEYFIKTKTCPFPNYKFTGENLSHDYNIEIRIEDGYFSKSDAAVVFQRIDKRTNEVTYIYHGNDGTNMPWNDTAQLNLLEGYVREAVIQKIFEVARKFSIIRFDAAMTLTKRHFSRLWYPQPGKGGDIPSRSDFALSKEKFDEKFPVEFWREVVDRINSELPETLLLAEAFWLMEGYFVRTLGMHRVYNSAFMHMMMKEENDKYRDLITNTLEYEPEILKRYVNFMSNPDEETAIKQFGTDDKYFGVLTMMICLPGLPMFAHGQIEGFTEKYGMEYQRSYYNESPKEWLVERHKQQVFPIMKKRYLFAEVDNFLIYDFIDNYGNVNENVFAFTNSYGNEKSFVLYNNKYDKAEGKIFLSASKLVGSGDNKYLTKKSILESLRIKNEEKIYYVMFDEISKKHFIYHYSDFQNGLYLTLNGFEHRVFMLISEIHDSQEIFKTLYEQYRNSPIDNIDEKIDYIRLTPLYESIKNIFEVQDYNVLIKCLINNSNDTDCSVFQKISNKYNIFINVFNNFSSRKIDIVGSVQSFYKCLLTAKQINLTLAAYLESEKVNSINNVKSILISEKSNYNENLFLFLIINSFISIQMPSKRINEILDDYNFNRVINELLLKLGRGNYGVERELALIYTMIDYCEHSDNVFNEINLNDDLQSLMLEHFFKYWSVSFKNINVEKFLLVNEYQNIVYYSKERFEEFVDWITTISSMKLVEKLESENNSDKMLQKILLQFFDLNKKIKELAARSDYELAKLENLITRNSK